MVIDREFPHASDQMKNFEAHFFAELAVKINKMQKEGYEVIRLDEGTPDLAPPPGVVEALSRSAADPGNHRYQPHRGSESLRQAWASMYRNLYQVYLDPDEEILPVLGSKEGIFHLPLALINPGEIVLVPDPGYITYTRGTMAAGGTIYKLPLSVDNSYLPELSRIPQDILDRSRILWINYPNNPTAAFAPPGFFSEVIEFCTSHQILVCHDAAYCQVTYNGKPAPSILQFDGAKEIAVEFNSLSKSHNMAGWRVGAICGNKRVIRLLYTLKTNIDSGQFLPIMDAATAAMLTGEGWIRQRNAIYQERRDVVIRTLHKLGLQAAIPDGSLYVWSPVLSGMKSVDFCRQILDITKVSFTPGTVFGENGEGFMRISLSEPVDRIVEAMSRLETGINSIVRI